MRLFLIVLSFFVFNKSLYSDPQKILSLADYEFGEYLSAECVTCHHKSGISKGIPSINGLDAEDIVNLLVLYRSKEIENNVMQMIAGRLDDEQIGSLAVYFSKLKSSN